MAERTHLTREGNWLQITGLNRGLIRRPALFLDRDGVLLEEVDYLHRVEEMRVIEGGQELIAGVQALGRYVVLVTNQGGIGRGYYDWRAFAEVQDALMAGFRPKGAIFDMVVACPFHPRARGPYYHPDHPWRKPRPDMLIEAAKYLPIDMVRSWIIGDAASDLAAGRSAKIAGGVHVLTGHGTKHRATASR